MINLRLVTTKEVNIAMGIINMAKEHLKAQQIDQWQKGYPDYQCIERDILSRKGYFVEENDVILGYLCIDFEGEPAYNTMNGTWHTESSYVVVHRMAFDDKSRGKGISNIVFQLVEDLSRKRGITSFRVDTDADNKKMQHVLERNGFSYCGTIWFDHSEKIAFDKKF